MERRRRVDYFKVNPNGTIGEWLEEEVKNRKRIENEDGVKEFWSRRYGVKIELRRALEKGKGREGLKEMVEKYLEEGGMVP
ncbi:hypothetical protein TrVE_jg807 [Triparma verrucosa]|uniref:Uncharacterized protein n=1 Tax=Triparma verrucosa TaxID=1606542 RepID=A0A9W7BRR1_9STRA|nr:hypothetical protein TrVE_jg807 [Triparma verrucosa]